MNDSKDKTIIFVDIREFSEASKDYNIINIIDKLIKRYYEDIEKNFPKSFIKFLGDGAMILCSEPDISIVLESCINLKNDFKKLQRDLTARGTPIGLVLGFGITKTLNPTKIEYSVGGNNEHIVMIDYLDSRINLASRLCSIARPFGIVIDKNSFPENPDTNEFQKIEIIGDNIKGFTAMPDTQCWVNKDVKPEYWKSKIQIDQIKNEIHITGLCFYEEKLILVYRGPKNNIGANTWAGPGGRIQGKKNLVTELKDKVKAEIKLNIKNEHLLGVYYIENAKMPGIIYYCEIDSQNSDFIKYKDGCTGNKELKNGDIASFRLEDFESRNDILVGFEDIKNAFEFKKKYTKHKTNIRLQIGENCNFNCITCHKDNVRYSSSRLSVDKLIETYQKLNNVFDIENTTISGGEPLMNQSLWGIIDKLRECNSSITIKIVTNGSFLLKDNDIDAELVNKIAEKEIDLKISIYGKSDDVAKKVTNVEQKDYFFHLLYSIHVLHGKGVKLTINILYNSHIVNEIDKIIDEIREISVDINIKIIEMFKPIDNSYNTLFKEIKNEKLLQYKYQCCDHICASCFRKWGPIILPNGDVQICEKTPNDIRAIIEDNNIHIKSIDYSENIMKHEKK